MDDVKGTNLLRLLRSSSMTLAMTFWLQNSPPKGVVIFLLLLTVGQKLAPLTPTLSQWDEVPPSGRGSKGEGKPSCSKGDS